MRKKRNLDERLEKCAEITKSSPEIYKNKWREEFFKDAFRKSKIQIVTAVGKTKYPNPRWCCFLHTLPFIASGNVK